MVDYWNWQGAVHGHGVLKWGWIIWVHCPALATLWKIGLQVLLRIDIWYRIPSQKWCMSQRFKTRKLASWLWQVPENSWFWPKQPLWKRRNPQNSLRVPLLCSAWDDCRKEVQRPPDWYLELGSGSFRHGLRVSPIRRPQDVQSIQENHECRLHNS